MSETKHQFAANQASPSSNTNDIDKDSSKADWRSDSEGSLGYDETSDSCPPYRDAPPPFNFQAREIVRWTDESVKSDEKFQPNIKKFSSETIEYRADATARRQGSSPDVATSNDSDGLSLEVEYWSDGNEASESSPPYTGSPAPFEHQVEGIGGWTIAATKSEENCHRGAEYLIPSNFEEAKSISHGYRQALEKLVDYESAPVDSKNISTVSRRRHPNAVSNPPNANATWERLENNHFGKLASMFQDPYNCRPTECTINDPEKQAPIDVAGTSRRRYHYGGGYTVLVVALILGILLYSLDVTRGYRCSSKASPETKSKGISTRPQRPQSLLRV